MKHRLILISALLLAGLWVKPPSAVAATISPSASDKTILVGSTVTITVRISAGGQAINAADGALLFPRSTLSLQSISRNGSIFTFWAEAPHGSNSSGQIAFSGGLPTPGFSGSGGRIFQATFKAKAVGTAPITISGAHILANDGFGTNVYTGSGSTIITISEPTITPVQPSAPSAPGEPSPVLLLTNFANGSTWYSKDALTVSWGKPKNYLGTSIVLDQSKTTVPPAKISTTAGTAQYTLSSDGVWYLHVRHGYTTGWSATTTAVLRLDSTPPDEFVISVDRDRGETDPTPVIRFESKDVSSGISKYTIEVDGSAPQTVSSPYTLKGITGDGHRIKVTAYDQAGNARSAETVIGIAGYPAPIIKAISSTVALLDTVTARGTAIAGDSITIYLDGKVLGQSVAGKEDPAATKQGITVTAPWFFTSDQLIKPGRHAITATATAIDGRVSVLSDPMTLFVTGSSIVIGGRSIATIALAPVAALVVILLFLLNTAFLVKIWLSFRQVYRREVTVEEELDALRRRLGRERVSVDDVDQELYKMELELSGRAKRSATKKVRRKRSS